MIMVAVFTRDVVGDTKRTLSEIEWSSKGGSQQNKWHSGGNSVGMLMKLETHLIEFDRRV